VLLVDHDQAEVGHGGEDGRARPDGDPRLAGAQPPPFVVALALAERRVQQRHGVAEAGLEAGDGLRRERDLRDEHDHAAAGGERVGTRPQVDLGLARSGDAVQEVRAAPAHRLHGRRLLGRQLDRAVGRRVRAGHAAPRPRGDRHESAGLQPPQRAEVLAGRSRQPLEQRPLVAGQPLAFEPGRRARGPQDRPLATGRRQHERQRAGRRRAVLGRHPQRELHEVLRHALGADPGRPHEPVLRHLAARRDVDDHAVELLPPEGDPHDRADADRIVRRQVVERPGQLPGRRQRLDAGDHVGDHRWRPR
jgi:hypothetical protein